LSAAEDYSRVFRKAEKSGDGAFTFLWRDNGLGYARLGLAIAKKNIRRAVDRNRVKRLVRESFRHWQSHLAGTDVVVLSRRGLPLRDNKRLRQSLERHWQRLARRKELPPT